MQEVRLRQARRHRKTLRAVQGKTAAILERPQESRRCGRWRVTGGNYRQKVEEEIRNTANKERILGTLSPISVIVIFI